MAGQQMQIAALIKKADPDNERLVIFETAPPCQDFSPIGPGEGARGQLFVASTDFMQAIFDELPDHNTASPLLS